MNEALLMALYVLLIIFVITLIILVVRLMFTLNKVDYLVDDLTKKAKTLDGFFSVIDLITDKVGYLSDSIVGALLGLSSKLFKPKKKKKKDEEEDD